MEPSGILMFRQQLKMEKKIDKKIVEDEITIDKNIVSHINKSLPVPKKVENIEEVEKKLSVKKPIEIRKI